MVPDRFERYAVSEGPEGLYIQMRQASHCVGCGMLTLAALAVGLAHATSPFDGWWTWMGLCVSFGALIVMSALWTEDWLISSSEIQYQNSFRIRERCIQRSPCEPISLRVEVIPRDPDVEMQAQFPHVVHLIGPDGEEVGYGFNFRRSSNLDRFVETLRRVLPIEVDDRRPQKEGLDGSRKPPSAAWDHWLD
jgi:hypothetical protein